MRTIITQAIVLIAFTIGITASAQSQNPQGSYVISGQALRAQYEEGMRRLDMGDHLSAYAILNFYYTANIHTGTFNQNPQFRQQVEQALYDLGNYLGQAVSERDNLQNQLRACQQSCQGDMRTRSAASRRPPTSRRTPTNQLPRIPPLY
jgi:hypothetical protein